MFTPVVNKLIGKRSTFTTTASDIYIKFKNFKVHCPKRLCVQNNEIKKAIDLLANTTARCRKVAHFGY
jgi:hypothetical protein